MSRPHHLAVALGALAVLFSACSSACGADRSEGRDASPVVAVTAFYPLAEATQAVGGAFVDVVNLTPAGRGPHDLELSARQLEAFDDAALAVYVGSGFQPQVEDAVEGAPKAMARLDVLDVVDTMRVDPKLEGTQGEVDGEVLEGDIDPHVWLDPTRLADIVEAIAGTLAEIDPEHAGDYQANAAAYADSLHDLDRAYQERLAECRSRVIVTSHRAFGYLAERYDLRQIPIAGFSPEEEPDPKTLEAIADAARAEQVTTIFLESIAPPDLARTVAREVGAELDFLDPIEGLTAEQVEAGVTYASIMSDNLEHVSKGLGCS